MSKIIPIGGNNVTYDISVGKKLLQEIMRKKLNAKKVLFKLPI